MFLIVDVNIGNSNYHLMFINGESHSSPLIVLKTFGELVFALCNLSPVPGWIALNNRNSKFLISAQQQALRPLKQVFPSDFNLSQAVELIANIEFRRIICLSIEGDVIGHYQINFISSTLWKEFIVKFISFICSIPQQPFSHCSQQTQV